MRWLALCLASLLSLFFLLRRGPARSRAAATSRLSEHLGGTGKARTLPTAKSAPARLRSRLEGTKYVNGIRESYEAAGFGMGWHTFGLIWASLFVAFPALGWAVTGSTLSVPPALMSALLLPLPVVKVADRRRERRLSEKCGRLAADLALYLRCGVPLEEAVGLLARSEQGPLAGKLELFASRTAMGESPDAAFEAMARELGDPDLELIGKAAATSGETGSDISGIMDALGEALREKAAIRRELGSQTVQGKLSGRIVAGLPFLFLGLSALVSKGTLMALLGSFAGITMLAVAAVLDLLGFLWVRKILDIEI